MQHVLNLWGFISVLPVALQVIFNSAFHLFNPLHTAAQSPAAVVPSTAGMWMGPGTEGGIGARGVINACVPRWH